ncbi:MAG: hypothetical protein ACQETH_16625 [Candidatus Rifleibacteriota bacterium]
MRHFSIKGRYLSIALVLSLFFLLCPDKARAEETEFEFYFQHIEKVVEINNPEPQGWWENAKSFVKKGINYVKKAWEKNVTRPFLTGEGKKRWYSKKDENIAYDVQRTRVKSESHLLQLMGAENVDDLSDGQLALLAVYRHSKSKAIQERTPFGYRSNIKVILSDTTGFDNSDDNPHVRRDFWPYSQGKLIQMSSSRYNFPGSDKDAQSTFVHEFAHSMDRTIKEFIHPYGKDDSHYTNEKTRPRTAFVEGWAEFNEMLDSEDEVSSMHRSIKRIKIESKSEAGEYEYIDADSPDIAGLDLLSVEGINANILYRLSTEIPDGRNKVFKTFKGTRWKLFRNLKSFSRAFARKYPEDAAKLAEIFDGETHGKLSERELKHYAGSSDDVKEYIAGRGDEVQVSENNTKTTYKAKAPEKNMIRVNNMSTQDFSTALKKAHENVLQALAKYKRAVINQSSMQKLKPLQQELQKRQEIYKQLLDLRKK